MLQVSWKTANRWAKSGVLRAVKIGGRYRTSEEWIAAVMKPACPSSPASGVQINDSFDADCQILATRFGIKVPDAGVWRKA